MTLPFASLSHLIRKGPATLKSAIVLSSHNLLSHPTSAYMVSKQNVTPCVRIILPMDERAAGIGTRIVYSEVILAARAGLPTWVTLVRDSPD